MKNRPLVLAVLANMLFWPLLFTLAALRPDYSHLHRAVSELGSVGAPRMWLWNVAGFILPGLFLAIAGWLLGRGLSRGWILAALLTAGGALMAWAGFVPADMGDRNGLATRLHLLGAQGSLVTWVLALLWIACKLRGPWRNAAIVALCCLLALVIVLLAAMPSAPGLTQRLMFAVFLASYPAFALVSRRPG